MKIKKLKNCIKLTFDHANHELYLLDLIMNSDIEDYDLEFHNSQVDGWMYLFDSNQNKIYRLNDHNFDTFKLVSEIKNRTIYLYPFDNDETYADYEWNQR